MLWQLSEGSHESEIPFAKNKLTSILQPLFNGGCLLSVLCTVNTAATRKDDTDRALQVASQAQKIICKPKVNTIGDEQALSRVYKKQLDELR